MSLIGKKPQDVRQFQDMSAGQKSYLKELGVTEADFDRLPQKSKEQWVKETHDGYLEVNRGLK